LRWRWLDLVRFDHTERFDAFDALTALDTDHAVDSASDNA
jgi:hypothetical protein